MIDLDNMILEANQNAAENRKIAHDANLRAEMHLNFKYKLEDLRDKLARDKKPGQ